MKNFILAALAVCCSFIPQVTQAQDDPINFSVNPTSSYTFIDDCHIPRVEIVDANGFKTSLDIAFGVGSVDLSSVLSSYGGYEFGMGAFISPDGPDIINGSQYMNYSEIGDQQHWDLYYSICCNGEVYDILVQVWFDRSRGGRYGSISATVTPTGDSCE